MQTWVKVTVSEHTINYIVIIIQEKCPNKFFPVTNFCLDQLVGDNKLLNWMLSEEWSEIVD